jgi:hypothetical protein
MSAWLKAHPENAATMSQSITDLGDKIGDVPKTSGDNPQDQTVVDYINAKTADMVTSGTLGGVSDKVNTLIGTNNDDKNKSVRAIAGQVLAARFGNADDILVFNCGNSQIGTANEYT